MNESCNAISVVIRTLNEQKHIGLLLQKLRAQRAIGAGVEIVVVDSGSTDKTLDIVNSHGVRLVQITPNEFNYSTALNLGIQKSQGELIFVLSGHSVPISKHWASQIIKHFTDDKVAGVYCRQKAWDDANWHEKRRIKSVFDDRNKVFYSSDKQEINFSNAASCIRRCVWQQHNFKVIPAAEDREWAKWAVEKGYKIVYDADEAVYHSHNESARKTAARQVEIEKAIDIQKKRKRTIILTLYQAVKRFVNLTIYDVKTDASISKKIQAIIIDLKCALWFIIDLTIKRHNE